MVANQDGFESKIMILDELLSLRDEAELLFDQKYITKESILKRINIIKDTEMLDDKRVLAIGDGDLTATAIAIFGKPKEVLIIDIDKRLSEILFKANMEYDLPIRYLYHDMRVKIIEILLKQYSLIIMEPPRTKPAIKIFISRALQCLEPGNEDSIFISVPSNGEIREFFDSYITDLGLEVVQTYSKINEYTSDFPNSDFIQLKAKKNLEPTFTDHWFEPFFESEVEQKIKDYKCKCGEIYSIGNNCEFQSINELKQEGCQKCGYNGIFQFNSKIKLI